jgi:outer membrane protein
MMLAGLLLSALPVRAAAPDAPATLALRQAEDYALAHHPGVRGAELTARAAREEASSVKAGFFPQIAGIAEVATAGDATRIAASGGLNNPSVFQRQSDGLLATQLLTDFGRTPHLLATARDRAAASEHGAAATKARVLLDVDRAYFETLRAQALLRVADETVAARTLLADRVAALAKGQLKSGLDVSFAEVSRREAALLKLRAQDRLETAYASLAAALGDREGRSFALAEEPLATPPSEDVEPLIRSALDSFPERLVLRSLRDAARSSAAAARSEELPVVSALGAVGVSPWHDNRLEHSYGAAAVLVTVPLFTGGRLQARAAEAALQADAADSALAEEADRITRDVRVAWMEARTAHEAIDVTDHLLSSASQAYELAESRYNLGISSMVELGQAQLAKTEAEIASAAARYDYQVKSAELDFRTGRRRASADQ